MRLCNCRESTCEAGCVGQPVSSRFPLVCSFFKNSNQNLQYWIFCPTVSRTPVTVITGVWHAMLLGATEYTFQSSFKIYHFCILIQIAEFLNDRKFAPTPPPAQNPHRHPTLRPYLSARSYIIGSTSCLRASF
jgi:hypothetical protein